MINPQFIKDSNELIEIVKKRNIYFEHGNVLVMKVKVDRVTASGLHLADDYADREEYKSGFARIIALPSDYGSNGPLKVGSYVMYSHEARYPLYTLSIREVLGLEVPDKTLYAVQDNNVILTVESEVIEGTSNEHQKIATSST